MESVRHLIGKASRSPDAVALLQHDPEMLGETLGLDPQQVAALRSADRFFETEKPILDRPQAIEAAADSVAIAAALQQPPPTTPLTVSTDTGTLLTGPNTGTYTLSSSATTTGTTSGQPPTTPRPPAPGPVATPAPAAPIPAGPLGPVGPMGPVAPAPGGPVPGIPNIRPGTVPTAPTTHAPAGAGGHPLPGVAPCGCRCAGQSGGNHGVCHAAIVANVANVAAVAITAITAITGVAAPGHDADERNDQ